MKVRLDMACLACDFKTNVLFRRPDYFTPTTGTFECKECLSKSEYIVRLPKVKSAHPKNFVEFNTRIIWASDIGRMLLEEQAAEKQESMTLKEGPNDDARPSE